MLTYCPQLEANSLYIVTQSLLHGAFHWSFIHTDAQCSETRHHWASSSGGLSSSSSSSACAPLPESYISQYIGHASLKCASKRRVILAYFKVQKYDPIQYAEFRNVCQAAFPVTYDTVEENRANNITCRTWIWAVLDVLRQQGFLRRNDVWSIVEHQIVEQSRELERIYLTAFMRGEGYMGMIIPA